MSVADNTPQDPSSVAYRNWMRHVAHGGTRCEECVAAELAGNPHNGCEDGRMLWAAYRLVRISVSIPITDGS